MPAKKKVKEDTDTMVPEEQGVEEKEPKVQVVTSEQLLHLRLDTIMNAMEVLNSKIDNVLEIAESSKGEED